MDEWIPSDKYLIDVLCRVRETNWKWADYRANKALSELNDGTVRYDTGAPFGEYGEYLWKKQNYPEIPPGQMLSSKAWRFMTLTDVLSDVFSQKGPEADGYRQCLLNAIVDYQLAAKSKLLDFYQLERDRYKFGSSEFIAMEDKRQVIRDTKELGSDYIPENPEGYWFIEFLGDEKRDEYDVVYDEHLIKRIIATQKLQALISERVRQSALMGQIEEPMADGQRGRKVKLLPEVFDREIFPILDKEFPIGGTNDGIKKRCAEIGEQYGVSESTIKNRFYNIRYAKQKER